MTLEKMNNGPVLQTNYTPKCMPRYLFNNDM